MIDGLVHDYSNSGAITMELLQSCTNHWYNYSRNTLQITNMHDFWELAMKFVTIRYIANNIMNCTFSMNVNQHLEQKAS